MRGTHGRIGLRGCLTVLAALEARDLIALDPTRGKHLVLELTDRGSAALGLPATGGRRMAVSKSFETAQQHALFDALVRCRDEIAARTGKMGLQIARLSDLRMLVHQRPPAIEEIDAPFVKDLHASGFPGDRPTPETIGDRARGNSRETR